MKQINLSPPSLPPDAQQALSHPVMHALSPLPPSVFSALGDKALKLPLREMRLIRDKDGSVAPASPGPGQIVLRKLIARSC